MRKPQLFIASSEESLPIADAVNVNLDHDLEVTIWRNGTFRLSSSLIDDLVTKTSVVDFALFIFAPDDVATIKRKDERVVRDNVLFEMGLFVGAIGKSRSFVLKPRDNDMHLPTDLLGMVLADFDANRSDGDLVSATNRACSLIKSEIKQQGLINRATPSESRKITSNLASYEIKIQDYTVLSACLNTHVVDPGGMAFAGINNSLRGAKKSDVEISLIKLERMGLVSKSVETDPQEGYDFYVYSITEMGIDSLLKNEGAIQRELSKSADHLDTEIPF